MKSATLRLAFVAAAACSFMVGMAVAQQGGPQGTPGWQYGGYNCGCISNNQATIFSCRNCCRNAVLNGNLSAAEGGNCAAFCGQMGQPCQP